MIDLIKKKLKFNQKILAVSKLQSPEKIKILILKGQFDFGENYIQEALEKIDLLKNYELKWHLIGRIQKNKIKFLKNNFEYIHSINSFEIAEIISKKASEINYVQKVFIQINLSDETTKSGFNVFEFEENWANLKLLKNISIIGLMTMPPLQNDGEKNRFLFKKLKKLAEKYQLTELSMGTSHDYVIALEEGSTWIRLGTLLFGERTK